MPPDAFTPIPLPTTRRISATSSAVAPPGPNPVAPPGVLFAAKRGLARFANMVGAGVFDGRALAPWSAGLTRRLLDEEPVLFESLCLDLGDPAARETYLADPAAWPKFMEVYDS